MKLLICILFFVWDVSLISSGCTLTNCGNNTNCDDAQCISSNCCCLCPRATVLAGAENNFDGACDAFYCHGLKQEAGAIEIPFPYVEEEKYGGGKNPYNRVIRYSKSGVFLPFDEIIRIGAVARMHKIRIALVNARPVIVIGEAVTTVVWLDFDTPIKIKLDEGVDNVFRMLVDIEEVPISDWETRPIAGPLEMILYIKQDNTVFFRSDDYIAMRALRLFDCEDWYINSVCSSMDSSGYTCNLLDENVFYISNESRKRAVKIEKITEGDDFSLDANILFSSFVANNRPNYAIHIKGFRIEGIGSCLNYRADRTVFGDVFFIEAKKSRLSYFQ